MTTSLCSGLGKLPVGQRTRQGEIGPWMVGNATENGVGASQVRTLAVRRVWGEQVRKRAYWSHNPRHSGQRKAGRPTKAHTTSCHRPPAPVATGGVPQYWTSPSGAPEYERRPLPARTPRHRPDNGRCQRAPQDQAAAIGRWPAPAPPRAAPSCRETRATLRSAPRRSSGSTCTAPSSSTRIAIRHGLIRAGIL
jgi:hypothetical protein